jgi:hypothetical protein
MCGVCSRRTFLAGAVLAFAGRAAANDEGASRQGASCCMPSGTAPADIFSVSGSPELDRALIAELRQIIGLFRINPGFQYVYDPRPNAFASATSIVSGTWGTVFIGVNLVESEVTRKWGGVAVAGICAHECGHIFQMQNSYEPLLDGPTPVLFELHADCMAGIYMGKTRVHAKERVSAFAASLFARGDYNFNSPYHHGAPEERVAAMEIGYELGGLSLDVAEAARIAAQEIRVR